MRAERGFTLFEIVVTLVLLGIVGALSSMFLVQGVESYVATARNSESGLNAQRALDRISLELKECTAITAFSANTSITYRNPRINDALGLSAVNRVLRLDGTNLVIDENASSPNGRVLLDQVTNFSMALNAADLDGDGTADDVRSIAVSFKHAGMATAFQIDIYPRALLTKP